MSKTSVEIDRELERRARAILGTRSIRETIHAAMQDVVDARRRLEAIKLFGEEDRFDFDAVGSAWGGKA